MFLPLFSPFIYTPVHSHCPAAQRLSTLLALNVDPLSASPASHTMFTSYLSIPQIVASNVFFFSNTRELLESASNRRLEGSDPSVAKDLIQP